MSLDWDRILDPNEIVRALLIWVGLALLGLFVSKYGNRVLKNLLSQLSGKVKLEFARHYFFVERFKASDDATKLLYLTYIRSRLWKRHRELAVVGSIFFIMIWATLSQSELPQRLVAMAILAAYGFYLTFLAWKDAQYSLLYSDLMEVIGEKIPQSEFEDWFKNLDEAHKLEAER